MNATISKIPDVIVQSGGMVRLVSADAKSWAYANTDIKRHHSNDAVPDVIWTNHSVIDLMSDSGLVVARQRPREERLIR